jgi:hypothetical protein
MSIFNKPYKSDLEMQEAAVDSKHKSKMRSRRMSNSLADKIFRGTIAKIDKGTDNFSKDEMIRAVAGSGHISPGERWVWNSACNCAIGKIRRFYWSDEIPMSSRRMFSYVRDRERYWLIPVNGDKKTALAINVVVEGYDRKMKGERAQLKKIANSAYKDMLKLDPAERNELIAKLREEHLLNGDTE